MISNLRISVVELVVWAGLAAAGLTWLVLGVRNGAEQAWDWLRHDRVTSLLKDDQIIAGKCEACWSENNGEGCDWAMCGCACHDDECEHEYTPNEIGTYEWCQKCDSVRPTLLALPPERTWEQMTSHQLPVCYDDAPAPALVRATERLRALQAERERLEPDPLRMVADSYWGTRAWTHWDDLLVSTSPDLVAAFPALGRGWKPA